MASSELHDVIVVNDLDDTLKYHELSREELDVPCSVDHCRELAMKIERWELLLPHIGLDECYRIAIKEDHSSSYEEQRITSLSKWKGLYGRTATYLKLAEGLKKIGRLDLIDELCKIYKSKPAEPYQQQDITDDERKILIKTIAKEQTHLKQRRGWKEILDDPIIIKTGIVSYAILVIAFILGLLYKILPSSVRPSSEHLGIVILFLYGMGIPMVPTYYIGGALLKKANGDVWKNVVIGGGLLGGFIGGVYWKYEGKNLFGTHLSAAIGISISVVMFGTILAGVLLAMAINRGTYAFLRIIVTLLVGAACFYAVSPGYSLMKVANSILSLSINVLILSMILSLVKYPLCMHIFFIPMCGCTFICNYIISFFIWPSIIAGAYWGTVLGGVWIYIISY